MCFDFCYVQCNQLICRECGKVIDFKWQEFDSVRLPREIANLGKVYSRHVKLIGICKECMNKGG